MAARQQLPQWIPEAADGEVVVEMADHCSYANVTVGGRNNRVVILKGRAKRSGSLATRDPAPDHADVPGYPREALRQGSALQAEGTNVDTDPSGSSEQLVVCSACDKVFQWKRHLIEHTRKGHCQNVAGKSSVSGIQTTSLAQLSENRGLEFGTGHQEMPVGICKEGQAEIQDWQMKNYHPKVATQKSWRQNYTARYRECIICGKNKLNHPNLSFHTLPQDHAMEMKWHKAVGKWLEPTETICINHFRYFPASCKGPKRPNFVPEPNFDRSLQPQSTGNVEISVGSFPVPVPIPFAVECVDDGAKVLKKKALQSADDGGSGKKTSDFPSTSRISLAIGELKSEHDSSLQSKQLEAEIGSSHQFSLFSMLPGNLKGTVTPPSFVPDSNFDRSIESQTIGSLEISTDPSPISVEEVCVDACAKAWQQGAPEAGEVGKANLNLFFTVPKVEPDTEGEVRSKMNLTFLSGPGQISHANEKLKSEPDSN